MSIDLVALDIGGTNARFAPASIARDGSIELGEPVTLRTSAHTSLTTAWEEYCRLRDRPPPRAAAIAIAAPVTGEIVRMTNNSWVLDTSALDRQLGLDQVTVINDFGAIAHAVAQSPAEAFTHLAGPETGLPQHGTITVIGPGTGLGVAYLRRYSGGYHVQATEGAHTDFAPVDHIDDMILARLRARHRRVSTERVVSGPGIIEIYQTVAAIEQRTPEELDDAQIWQRGLAGEDSLAAAAVQHFCLTLGSTAGDYALAHGATGVVIAGGLGLRLRDILPRSGFAERFRFKGRYEQMMAGIPVVQIIDPQPGLYGAVAAFAQEHLSRNAA